MLLGGTWRAAVADEALRRRFADSGADDDGWEPGEVPGHWQSTPAFAASDGPLLYRRRFEAERPVAGERAWPVLDGLFYQGDVWLDGDYLGATEGSLAPGEAEAWAVTEEGRSFYRGAADGWAVAHTASGEDAETAQQRADATYGFYTGTGQEG